MPQTYPLINGNKHDFSSIELRVNGLPVGAVKSIDYKATLTPGMVRGNNSQVIARTKGQYSATGSVEMYKSDAQDFIAALAIASGGGFMEAVFVGVVMYSSPGDTISTDVLAGCRITDMEDSHSESGEALTTKFSIDILYFLPNGVRPMTAMKF